jgi:hypothetical protein
MNEEHKMSMRDSVRAAIFNSPMNQQKSEAIEFMGAQVEVRQPLVEDIMAASKEEDGGVVMMLVRYTFVPGTNERVFDAEDAEALLKMPFGRDMSRFLEVVKNMTDIDLKVQEKN